MKKPAMLIAIASVVALFVVGIAVATSWGSGSSPAAESDDGSVVDSGGGGGGLAAGACPAADVPGISDEERERCFEADGGGGKVDEDPADSPVTDEGQSPAPSEQDPGTAPVLPEGRRAEPAPIDGLDVRVAESFPPQYFLSVLAGLPSGCAEQYRHEVSRDGNVITVTVLNSFPEGNPVCTMIYGMYELDIALGSDFEPGQTYTVVVNDQETEFTAQ